MECVKQSDVTIDTYGYCVEQLNLFSVNVRSPKRGTS